MLSGTGWRNCHFVARAGLAARGRDEAQAPASCHDIGHMPPVVRFGDHDRVPSLLAGGRAVKNNAGITGHLVGAFHSRGEMVLCQERALNGGLDRGCVEQDRR
jgi:hypothetical protein